MLTNNGRNEISTQNLSFSVLAEWETYLKEQNTGLESECFEQSPPTSTTYLWKSGLFLYLVVVIT